MLSDSLADGKAIHPRHIDIQQNQVWLFTRLLDGLPAAVGGEDLVLGGEVGFHGIDNAGLIVHYQQGRFQGDAPFHGVFFILP